jgi:predicted Zn-dependent peptidase
MKKLVLQNGLTILVNESKDNDFVSMTYMVNAGSNDEPDDLFGIAHLTEHLVFTGTLRYDAADIWNEVEKYGGSLNACTTNQDTKFFCTSMSKYWKNVFEILSEIVWKSTIPKDEFEREKNVVLEELKMYNDSGEDKSFEMMQTAMFKNIKNRQTNGGTLKSVSKITRDDVINFINNFYIPKNVIFIITGNVNFDEVVDELNGLFKNLELNDNLIKYRKSIDSIDIQNVKEKFDGTQSHLRFYFPIETTDIKTHIVSILSSYIMGGGLSSRLSDIRSKYGYAYTVNCYATYYSDYSFVSGYAGLNKSNVKNTKRLIMNIFTKVTENGITNEEFIRARNVYENDIKLGSLLNDKINMMICDLLSINEEFDIDNIIDVLYSITVDDINDFFKKYYDNSKIGFIELLQNK